MVNPSRFVEDLQPYKITPQDVWAEGAEEGILKLDWNEATHDFDFYRKELRRLTQGRGVIAWYPDYLSIELNAALSQYLGVEDNLLLTFPGSDVGLETVCRAYLDPGDKVLILTPSYENFYVYAKQTGAELIFLNLAPPFNVSFDQLRAEIISHSPKMVYIVNPNNPCGYSVDPSGLEKLISEFGSTLFIVDEAYIEFATIGSMVSRVSQFSNLLVARTFSKAFGLAGLRLGYVCSSNRVINTLNKIRNGKNLSMIAQKMGVFALQNIDKINTWIAEVKTSRDMLFRWFESHSVTVYPSQANFLLFTARRPEELCSEMKFNGIYLRNRNALIPGCVRVTLGSVRDTEKLITKLSELLHLIK